MTNVAGSRAARSALAQVRGRWPFVLPWVVLAVLVPVRLSDLWNVKAAGIDLTLLEVVALGYHLRAATRRGLTRAARLPWVLTSATLVTALAGGVGFSVVYDLHLPGWTPAMVVAIAGRAGICPVLLGALLSFAAEPMHRQARWKLAMDVTTVLGAGLMVMWYLVLGPALINGRILDPLRLGSVLFAVGDVVLLVGVGTVLMRGSAGTARRPLALLTAGTAGYLVIDVLYLYQTVRMTGPPALVPTLLIMPIFLILLSAVGQPAPGGTPRGGRPERPVRRHAWLPYQALACGYGLLLLAAVRAGPYPWVGLVSGALLMTLGVVARQIAASRENYALVITDSLTGLANRRQLRAALGSALDRSRRAGGSIAVLLLDLDDFKLVNDAYGHEVGDQLLVRFADLLRRTVRDSDVPARLGGDEFAVVLPEVGGDQDATRVAARILAECRPPLILSGHTVRLRVSIGVAVVDQGPDASPGTIKPDDLLHRADKAMYEAKRRGSHGWALYSPQATATGQAETGWAEEPSRAIDERQLHGLSESLTACEQVLARQQAHTDPQALTHCREALAILRDLGIGTSENSILDYSRAE